MPINFAMYRNPDLTKTAKNAPCMMNIAGVCNYDESTTVWAHSNLLEHGKGRGVKAHDVFGACLCSSCHMWLDAGMASKEDKEWQFRAAMDKTLLYLWVSGKIQVVGETKHREKEYKPLSKILPRRF